MAVLRILFTRLRTEEKLLKEAAERLGIPCELQLVSDTVFGGEPFCSQDDVCSRAASRTTRTRRSRRCSRPRAYAS